MKPLNIGDKYLSQNCIEKCIEKFEQIKNESNPILDIIFTEQVLEIDPLLLAYFILFKKQKENLNINLNFSNKIVNEALNKILQFRAHIQLITGENYFNIINDVNYTISERLFIWSEKFLPVLYIDENNYKYI